MAIDENGVGTETDDFYETAYALADTWAQSQNALLVRPRIN